MSAVRFALFAGSLAGLFAVLHPALGAVDSAALCAASRSRRRWVPSTTAGGSSFPRSSGNSCAGSMR